MRLLLAIDALAEETVSWFGAVIATCGAPLLPWITKFSWGSPDATFTASWRQSNSFGRQAPTNG